jgi:hypothetical protein
MMTVFAFDLGLGSMGACVRQNGFDIPELKSLLVDVAFPCITDKGKRQLTKRMRAKRQRTYRKARRQWFESQWQAKGLTPLETGNPLWDAPYTEGHYYTPLMLRCALLLNKTTHPNGDGFEDWELYAALWSSVQKRGYQATVAYANQGAEISKYPPKEMSDEEKKRTQRRH